MDWLVIIWGYCNEDVLVVESILLFIVVYIDCIYALFIIITSYRQLILDTTYTLSSINNDLNYYNFIISDSFIYNFKFMFDISLCYLHIFYRLNLRVSFFIFYYNYFWDIWYELLDCCCIGCGDNDDFVLLSWVCLLLLLLLLLLLILLLVCFCLCGCIVFILLLS